MAYSKQTADMRNAKEKLHVLHQKLAFYKKMIHSTEGSIKHYEDVYNHARVLRAMKYGKNINKHPEIIDL
jgi:hypothetical protein